MATATGDQNPGVPADHDPVTAALERAVPVVVLAAALAVVTDMGARLPEPAWQEMIEDAAGGPAMDYPPGYTRIPDDELGGPIGRLGGVDVTRLAQLRHEDYGSLTVVENQREAGADTLATIVGEAAGVAGASASLPVDDFDATLHALTAERWRVVYVESFETRLRDVVHAESARRRAALAEDA